MNTKGWLNDGGLQFAHSLIGREAEIAAISSLLDGIPAGPSSLLLQGEPGIGKTTVLRAGLDDARRRSMIVLHCQPAEAEWQLSFNGLGDLLREVL